VSPYGERTLKPRHSLYRVWRHTQWLMSLEYPGRCSVVGAQRGFGAYEVG